MSAAKTKRTQPAQLSASEISAKLKDNVLGFCQDFLPNGKRDGRHWRIGDVHGNPGQSMVVDITGPRAGTFKDFSADEGGDLLELLRLNQSTDIKGAIAIAKQWLGISEKTGRPGKRRHVKARTQQRARHHSDSESRQRKRVYARELWQSSKPAQHTLVEAYLRGRGITLAVPPSIRLAPLLKHRPSEAERPCMIAGIWSRTHLGDYELVSVHRTWLAPAGFEDGPFGQGGAWIPATVLKTFGPEATVRKYDHAQAKMVAAPYQAGFIPLTKKTNAEDICGPVLALTEGIETGLSVAQAMPGWSVWSAVSVGNFKQVRIPKCVRRLVLCADGDSKPKKNADGSVMLDDSGAPVVPADLVLQEAARVHANAAADLSRDLKVEIARPPAGMDFNDLIQRGLQ